MIAKLRSDKILRKALKTFFSLAEADVQPNETAGEHIIFEPGGRFVHGVWFIETKATKTAGSDAINRLTHIMGPVFSDEEENYALIWKIAAERSKSPITMSVGDAIGKVFADLIKNVVKPRTFINQNCAVAFRDSINDLRIGPVRAVKRAILETELSVKEIESEYLSTIYATPYGDEIISDERIKPDLLWEISITASIKNIMEQAVWMIDVALGFIRIAEIQQPHYHPYFSSCPEANPFWNRSHRAYGVLLEEGCRHFLSDNVDTIWIDAGIHATLMTDPCMKYMAIFNAKKGSVGARIAQGLGWMTRGRQASDRSQRLLYFFTAMESLLTSSDKAAPVIQTIARHASVILAKTPETRIEIANKIKKLYGARSSLVHAGERTVTRYDADLIQSIVESIYLSVMSKVDPMMNFDELNTALATASYGGPWP